MIDKNIFRPRGIYAAMVTPMHSDGSLRLEQVPLLCQWLRAQGVEGLFVAGTTGEGRQLRDDERCQLLDSVMAAREGLPVIVHVGHDAQRASIDLALHARHAGAEAIAVAPPAYHVPGTVESLLAYYRPICEAVAELPFFHYHIPALSGCQVSAADFLIRSRREIPNMAGIKYTDERLMDFQRCLDIGGEDCAIGFGRDQQLLSVLPYGCDWAVGSTYNVLTPLYKQLIGAFKHGDLSTAQQLQLQSIWLVQAMQRCACGQAAIKAILSSEGIDCGPVRAPLDRPATEALEQCVAVYHSIKQTLKESVPC